MKKLFTLLSIIATIAMSAQVSQNVDFLFNWHDPTITPASSDGIRYNEVWGYAANGREYAILGSAIGTHIFDVTDPVNSTLVDYVPGKAQGATIIHRDYHDYNGYLYAVCDEGSSTLQIMDLQYLPDSVHVVYDSDSLIIRAHNIFIDSTTANMYVCSMLGYENSSLIYTQLGVVSLANPTDPQLILNYNTLPDIAHDAYVHNDTAYLNLSTLGLFIVDFSNISSPSVMGSLLNYPDKGYNHSGWPSEDGNYYFFADETNGMKLKSLDVSDYSNLTVIDTFGSNVDVNSIAHNQIVKGDYLYSSYYEDGLQIFDISDPTNVVRTGYYDTYITTDYSDTKGAWGVYPLLPSGKVLVSDMLSGLYVFDVTNAISVSENSFNSIQINAYPNPFIDRLSIDFPEEYINKEKSVQLVNSLGQVVRTVNTFEEKLTIETTGLTRGIYIVKGLIDGNEFSTKMFKLE